MSPNDWPLAMSLALRKLPDGKIDEAKFSEAYDLGASRDDQNHF